MNTQEFQSGNIAKKKELIGNAIFEHIERLAGTEKAPKLTGMIIDLPELELYDSVSTFEKLDQKLKIGITLLMDAQNKSGDPSEKPVSVN